MCVENTVLAFMICLLFNSSYKVTITCKWHQLVYFAIITANKPNQPPHFHCISPFAFYVANLKVRPWYLTGSFPLNVFRGLFISHFIRPSLAYMYLKLPLSRPERILGNPAIAIAFRSTQPTSKISNPLNFLLLQTRPNCLGRSWNPSTKRPKRQLHS